MASNQYDSTTTTSHLLDESNATAIITPTNTTTSSSSSGIAASRRRATQNCLFFWVDINYNETNKDCQNTLAQLRSVVNDVIIYTDLDECIRFLRQLDKDQLNEEKVFIIISGSLGEHLVPDLHDMSKIDTIYIFCSDRVRHEEWTKTWVKIKGVYTSIMGICTALQLVVKQNNQDSIAVSFVANNETTSAGSLNQLEPTFMYTQMFKKILLGMKHEKQAIKDLINYYSQFRPGDKPPLDIINEFDRDYRSELAVWWYTRASFTYQIINQALRTLDGNTIINMGFFIHDLHQQIHALHQQQRSIHQAEPFTVYRGQGLSTTDFDKLLKTPGGLISFNNFLSTSKDRAFALVFADSALGNTDMVGVLFVMSIDPRVSSTPFADIGKVSYFQTEEEILFSMHTVFRLSAIKLMDNNSQVYEVELKLTADDDVQLRELTELIEGEVAGGTGWQQLGKLLLRIGQSNKAEELYNVLLEQTSNEKEKQYYHHQLGYVKEDQGDYTMALWYYEKALESKRNTFPPTDPELAASYNNIGAVYQNMGEYSKALSFFEKTQTIFEKTLSPTDSSLVTCYNNIGVVYKSMGEYSKALLFYEKGLEIEQKTLPPIHPELATSCNNIGDACQNMGDYSKALLFYEKALQIRQKSLDPTHPSLAISYNNIGGVYGSMGKYSQALSFHEKSLEIRQKIFSSTHPLLANSYNNIGSVYKNLGEYSKALSIYQKALQIQQETLPLTHPDLAASYNNIGLVYNRMGEYSKALSFYEKTCEIFEKTLASTHPDLATSYNNIGSVCYSMKEYSKALSYYKKALEIQQETLDLTHPSLAISYNNIGLVYKSMGEYSQALDFYEKSLTIRQKTLGPTHPSLATVYNNIGEMYQNMEEYLKALSFYDKALEIRRKNLDPGHPNMAISYNNFAELYFKMKEYSKALSNFQSALDIWQRVLPSDHSQLKIVKQSIEAVKYFQVT